MMRPGLLPAWYVIFMDSAARPWWVRLCRPGFQHVEAIAWDEAAGRWILFAPQVECGLIRAYTAAEFSAYMAAVAKRRATVVLARQMTGAPCRPRLFATCVTAISALLGLPGVCPVSPYGLYRKLLSLEALEVSNGQFIQRAAETG
jgi:hypothetical protein